MTNFYGNEWEPELYQPPPFGSHRNDYLNYQLSLKGAYAEDGKMTMADIYSFEVGQTYEMPIEDWEGHLPKGYHITLGSGLIEATEGSRGRVFTVVEIDRERGIAYVECGEAIASA